MAETAATTGTAASRPGDRVLRVIQGIAVLIASGCWIVAMTAMLQAPSYDYNGTRNTAPCPTPAFYQRDDFISSLTSDSGAGPHFDPDVASRIADECEASITPRLPLAIFMGLVSLPGLAVALTIAVALVPGRTNPATTGANEAASDPKPEPAEQ